MSESTEDNKPEDPIPNSKSITLGEIRDLEDAAEAGDVEAQKRLSEIEGVESYEEYKKLNEQIVVEIQASDVSNSGSILRSISEQYAPDFQNLSRRALATATEAIGSRMQDLSLRAAADVTQAMGPAMQNFAESAACRSATCLAAEAMGLLIEKAREPFKELDLAVAKGMRAVDLATEPMRQLSESVIQSFGGLTLNVAAGIGAAALNGETMHQLTQEANEPFRGLARSLVGEIGAVALAAEPLCRLSESVSQSLATIKSSPAELLDVTFSGKDLLASSAGLDFRLDTPFLTYAYVSPEERLADEMAEANRLQREILAELRKRPLGAPIPDRPQLPNHESPQVLEVTNQLQTHASTSENQGPKAQKVKSISDRTEALNKLAELWVRYNQTQRISKDDDMEWFLGENAEAVGLLYLTVPEFKKHLPKAYKIGIIEKDPRTGKFIPKLGT